MGIFPQMGVPPKWMVHKGKTPLKWMIWESPYFRKRSCFAAQSRHILPGVRKVGIFWTIHPNLNRWITERRVQREFSIGVFLHHVLFSGFIFETPWVLKIRAFLDEIHQIPSFWLAKSHKRPLVMDLLRKTSIFSFVERRFCNVCDGHRSKSLSLCFFFESGPSPTFNGNLYSDRIDQSRFQCIPYFYSRLSLISSLILNHWLIDWSMMLSYHFLQCFPTMFPHHFPIIFRSRFESVAHEIHRLRRAELCMALVKDTGGMGGPQSFYAFRTMGYLLGYSQKIKIPRVRDF